MLKKTLPILGILASIATIAAHSTTAVQNVKGSKEANKEVDQCGNFIQGSTIQGGSFTVNCERTKLSNK
jgi:hypothetical protein